MNINTFLYMTSVPFPFNILCPLPHHWLFQLVDGVCVYWGKCSLLIPAISPLEQAVHLGRRPANTNYKHGVWGGQDESSFISAHWTWLSRCKADSKVIFSTFSLLHSTPSPVFPPNQRKFTWLGHMFSSSALPFQIIYAMEMYVTPSITQAERCL